MLTMFASAHAPALESLAARRVLFTLPLGAALTAELQVQGSPAIAQLAVSQLKPAHNWADATAIDNARFEESLGTIAHAFRPGIKGLYMFDWQFYLSRATFRASVRLLVDGREQYARNVVAGAIPNLNPRGVIGFSVI